MSSANFLSGGIFSFKTNINTYFGLEEENKKLIQENVFLRKELEAYKMDAAGKTPDTSTLHSKYRFIDAQVINNSYSKTKNILTIQKGASDSVSIDMGVITSNGIVGIVNNVSKNYATVQSILNVNSQINARVKNSNHFGSLTWDTKKPNVAQLNDINRLASVKVGDTIITDGKSTIFPEGLFIGTIKAFELGENDNYNLDIQLFTDMTNLKHVYVIENKDSEEIQLLEKESEDEQ